MALSNQFTDTTSAVPGNLVTLYYAATGTVQGSASIGGYYDIPNVDVDEGSHTGYAGGSREPLYGVTGVVAPTFSNTLKVADITFLQYCFGTSPATGPFGVPGVDLWFGAADTPSYNGFMDKLAVAYCNSVSLNVQNQSGAEVTAAVEFWGKTYSQGATVANPTLLQLQTYGPPLTNLHLAQFDMSPGGSTTTKSFLDHWMSLQIGRQHNLERCCPQTDGTYGFIKTHNQTESFTAELYAPRLNNTFAYYNSLPQWGDGTTNAIEITLTNGVKTLHWKAKYATMARRTMKGGDIGGEWDGTLELQPRGVTVLYS